MSQGLEVTIQADGSVELSVKGLQGRTCLHLTQGIEALLGKVSDRKLTGEYDRVFVKALFAPYLSVRTDKINSDDRDMQCFNENETPFETNLF